MKLTEPWSKKHKSLTKAGAGGLPHSLSNSFAQPLTSKELIDLTRARGDDALVEAYMNHSLKYTANGGTLDLRQEIANMYGEDITAEHVLVFPGAQLALQTASMALVSEPGSHAIVFTPGYQSVQEGPCHAGAEVTRIVLKAEKGWQIDPEEVAAAVRPNTKYIVLNEPFNPGGTLMSRKAQDRIIEIAGKHGLYVLCDEVYRLLEHDPKERLPAMAEAYTRGISVVALSKPWGGCGVAVGWMAFRDLSLRQRFVDVQYFGAACLSRAAELLTLMCLRASEAILAKNLAIIRRNRAILGAFVEEENKEWFEWVPPSAGAIAFLRFKGPWTTERLGTELATHGIGIKPAFCFSRNDEVTAENDYFRIGYGEECVPSALKALGAFVAQHAPGWREEMAKAASGGAGGGGGGEGGEEDEPKRRKITDGGPK